MGVAIKQTSVDTDSIHQSANESEFAESGNHFRHAEFTEDDIVEHHNCYAPIDGRMLPRKGQKTGRCSRCGEASGPYSLCRKHREHQSIKRILDQLVDKGELERVSDGRGKKGGATYRNLNFKKNEPYLAVAKPGRNEPCHCGSGQKFKRCCGANA